jgi:uncharacterized protein (TIGR00255 family)
MIRSMTGFGRGEAESEGTHISVEVRSVNHRYLDVSVRLPKPLASLEAELRRYVQERVDRGKISVAVDAAMAEGDGATLRLDDQRLRDYLDIANQLRIQYRLGGELSLSAILALPDVVTEEQGDQNAEAWWQVLRQALDRAIQEMVELKTKEGDELARDMFSRLDRIERLVGMVEARAPVRVAELRERVRERLAQIVDSGEVDPYRLEQEIVFQADRMDCTEECVRLRSHIKHFRDFATAEGSAGRKLNFLLQEMHREATTIGSKASDAEIAVRTVEIKEEIERIREQIQNVE